MIYRPSEAFRFLLHAHVLSLRQSHFGFWRRNNKKAAINNPVATSAQTFRSMKCIVVPALDRRRIAKYSYRFGAEAQDAKRSLSELKNPLVFSC